MAVTWFRNPMQVQLVTTRKTDDSQYYYLLDCQAYLYGGLAHGKVVDHGLKAVRSCRLPNDDGHAVFHGQGLPYPCGLLLKGGGQLSIDLYEGGLAKVQPPVLVIPGQCGLTSHCLPLLTS